MIDQWSHQQSWPCCTMISTYSSSTGCLQRKVLLNGMAWTRPEDGCPLLFPLWFHSPRKAVFSPLQGGFLLRSREGLLPPDLGLLHRPQIGVINDALLPVPTAGQGGVLLQDRSVLLLSSGFVLWAKAGIKQNTSGMRRETARDKNHLWCFY